MPAAQGEHDVRATVRQCLGCRLAILRRQHIACVSCWYRLPLDVRELRGLDQAKAAVEWFRANPEEGQS